MERLMNARLVLALVLCLIVAFVAGAQINQTDYNASFWRTQSPDWKLAYVTGFQWGWASHAVPMPVKGDSPTKHAVYAAYDKARKAGITHGALIEMIDALYADPLNANICTDFAVQLALLRLSGHGVDEATLEAARFAANKVGSCK